MSKLVALVGTNIGEKRYEEGEVIDADLSDKQRRFLTAEGYAVERESGQRLPAEVKEAIESGAATENPVIERMDTKETADGTDTRK